MPTRLYNEQGHYWNGDSATPTKSAQAVQAASDAYALREFIGREQLRMLRELVRPTTEEHEHFRGILRTYITRIEAMPVEYRSDQEAPLAYLHYFKGNCDWYIVEKDSDPDKEGQIQCMGFANLGDPINAEVGYINVKELVANNVELDLYWTPKPLQPIIDAIKRRI